VIEFITIIVGAISIALGTLSLYARPYVDPDEFPPNHRPDVLEMKILCQDLGRDDKGTDQLSGLLALCDEFVSQQRTVTDDQLERAKVLAR
jgi:hypothetical protein